jgi:hypothetical protein
MRRQGQLAVVVVALLAIGCAPRGGQVDVGSDEGKSDNVSQRGSASGLGEPCTANNLCEAGLVCTDGYCVEPGAYPIGQLGDWCAQGGLCEAGLVCTDGYCVEPGTTPAGGIGQRCAAGGLCDVYLVCRDGVCLGAAGAACVTYYSGGDWCDEGLSCWQGVCSE